MGTFTIEGTAKGNGANAVLAAIAQEAAKSTPYNVTVFSGKRFGGGSSMHDKNQAVDIVLTDPATGAEIPNLKSSIGFPIYEAFAAQMRAAQVKVAPQYSNSFRWGGWFGSSRLNPGGVDLMHFDLKSSKMMVGGDWTNGTYASFRRYINTLGAGMIYSAKGQRAAVNGGAYPNLWGETVSADTGVPLPRLRPDYDPNNPNNLRPPLDIPSASDRARAFGASRAIADRQAVLDNQPKGERNSIAPLSGEHRRMLTVAEEQRAQPAPGIPTPRQRPTFLATQQAIRSGTYLRKGGGTKAANAEVQKFLNDQGITDAKGRALKVDGVIGPRTRAAITAYQQERGLRPDGVVGIKTLADMAAVQEQADNPVTRGQSPEMGGDRFDVAQVIEGPAPGLPGGGVGSDFAASMGQSLAVNLSGGAGALDALVQPGFGIQSPGGGYMNIPRDIWSSDSSVVSKTFRDPLGMPDGIDVTGGRNLGFMDRAPVNFENATDAPQYTPGMLRDQKSAKDFGDFLRGAGSMVPKGVLGDEPSYLTADELQFQADLTPSLGGAAAGSALGGAGGATSAVIGNYAKTARELAAFKASQAGRAISLGAAVDPFANLKAAQIAQANAFSFSQAQAAALAASLNAGGGADSVFTGGGSQSGYTSPSESRNSSSGGGNPTSPGTSPGGSIAGGGSNTVSNPGGMGGSSTSPGTSSSLGGGGGRTGSSSRSNP